MKMEVQGDALRISSVTELGAANAKAFRHWVFEAFENGHRNIEIDLSQTAFIDSSGLGALIALHKKASSCHGKLLLLRPQPAVQQIIELTRLDRLFEVIKR